MDKQKNAIEAYKMATETLGQTDLGSILTVIFFILFFILLFIGFSVFSKNRKKKQIRSSFLKYAKDKGLSSEEAEILWDYSNRFGRDPSLVLEFKSPFEKVIDSYIKDNPQHNPQLIKNLRKKLGFDIVYLFVPLSITKDIELFQHAKMTIENETPKVYEVSLLEKDETHMQWIVFNMKRPDELKIGSKVKITFLRKGDAIYSFRSTVESAEEKNAHIVLTLLHTFELTRTQRREFPRVETELLAQLGIVRILDGQESIEWHQGKIFDISASGARFCIPSEAKTDPEAEPGNEVEIKFEISGKTIASKAKIINIDRRQTHVCFGLSYLDMSETAQDLVFGFVNEKQKKLAQLMRSQK